MFCGQKSHRSFDRSGRGQRGVALLLALVFVAFFGGILVAIATFNNGRVRVAEAEVAGWEAVEIAKAARLFVRDQLVATPNLRTIAGTPSRITLTALKAGGYLSPNFGRTIGALDYNALNQEIYVIRANWGTSGLSGPTTNAAVVPSAFIYFRNGGKSSPNLVVTVVEHARKFGATITAPLFDLTGTNRSAICRGAGPAVGLWDTGCLTQPEFATMAAALGLPTTFTGGALILPAWKAIQPDLRAVMRFPQPENPGYSTMLTDLEMGIPTVQDCPTTADQVSVTTVDASGNPTTSFTGLCTVRSDTGVINQRYNIDKVANITAERIIAEPQTLDFGPEAALIGTANDESLQITGNATLGSDLRVFNSRPLGAIPYRFSVPNASLAVERNAYLYSQNTSRKGLATIGTATGNALITDSMTSQTYASNISGTTTGTPRISITKTTNITGNTSVIGAATAELITDTMTGTNATVSASDNTGQVQITNTLNMSGANLNVTGTEPIATGTGSYAATFGSIDDADNVTVSGDGNAGTNDLQFLSTNGTISAQGTRNTAGAAALPTLTVVSGTGNSSCLEGLNVSDACPNRQYFPPSITP